VALFYARTAVSEWGAAVTPDYLLQGNILKIKTRLRGLGVPVEGNDEPE
jgi:hypothetical protein